MSDIAAKGDAGAPPPTPLSTARRNYILFVLILVGTMSWLDRQVLNILIVPIRTELELTDTQIGFVTGIAFMAVYATLALPIARIADRWSRRNVIAIAITVWSLMTAACGLAHSFVQLFLARIGVAVGESGGSAPAQATVGDMFKRDQRATALSIFFLSSSLGSAIGMLWGGLAIDTFGWRTAFFVAGVPGLILGPLVYFTLPNLRQGHSDGVQKPLAQPPFFGTIWLLLTTGSFRNMLIGATVKTFFSAGMQVWIPSFLARSHGMSMKNIGISLALISGISYAIGALVGGRLVDVLGRRDPRWHFWIGCGSVLVTGALAATAFMVPTNLVLIVIGLQMTIGSMWAAPMTSITQNLAPVAFRATANAFLMFVVNFLAIGVGPQIVGVISDLFRDGYGEGSLRVALLCSTIIAVPASFFFYRASVTYRTDLAAADTREKAALA